MRVIHKFPLILTDKQSFDLPADVEFLTVQVQRGVPCLWALIETDNPTRPHEIAIYGTGHLVRGDGTRYYIGTFQLEHGAHVFHVFHVAYGEGS